MGITKVFSLSWYMPKSLSLENNEIVVAYGKIYKGRFPRFSKGGLAKRLALRLGCAVEAASYQKFLLIRHEDQKVTTGHETKPHGSLRGRGAEAELHQTVGEGRKVPEKALPGGEAAMVETKGLSLAAPVGYSIKPIEALLYGANYRWTKVVNARRPRRWYNKHDKERVNYAKRKDD